MVGWGHGHGIIMDKHYRVVKSVEPSGNYMASSDMHEFIVLPDGKTALMSQFIRSAYDLCAWDICNGLGYIQEGAFQEVDIETGNTVFEWRSLDHVDTSESYIGPGTTEISGTGREPALPWDYFHINSIDKNAEGDYLISARHTSCIYKISGKDGHVIWRLNGAKSDFRLKGFETEYGFSFQHDARFISQTATTTTISLFDNGGNGFNFTQTFSSGMVVVLNHVDKTATLQKEMFSPLLDGEHHMSKSQGNTQILPNGNVVLGWGNNAFYSEHLSNGTAVWYGALGYTNLMNYRAHKFNWTGLPLTKPALWTYSRTGTNAEGMMFYMSWNGATEVRSWTLYTAPTATGSWSPVTTLAKDGFETIWHNDLFAMYSYVVALDKDGKVMSKSEVQKTFVPSAKLRPNCDELACFSAFIDEDAVRLKEEEEQLERERLEAEEQERIRIRQQRYRTSFGAIGCMLLVCVVFVARRSISRALAGPVAACTYYVSDVAAFALRRARSGKGRYKVVSADERAGFDTPDSDIALEPS